MKSKLVKPMLVKPKIRTIVKARDQMLKPQKIAVNFRAMFEWTSRVTPMIPPRVSSPRIPLTKSVILLPAVCLLLQSCATYNKHATTMRDGLLSGMPEISLAIEEETDPEQKRFYHHWKKACYAG